MKLYIFDVGSVMRSMSHFTRDFSVDYNYSVKIDGETYPVTFPTGSVFTFINTLQSVLNKNDRYVFAFDSSSWRKKVYQDYKANRPSYDFLDRKTKWIMAQIEFIFENVTDSLPIFSAIKESDMEADDIIAEIVRCNPDIEKIIISNDMDLSQLVNATTSMKTTNSRMQPIVTVDAFARMKGSAIPYNSTLLYKAIMGDPSDNIAASGNNSMFHYVINAMNEKCPEMLPQLNNPENARHIAKLLPGLDLTQFNNNIDCCQLYTTRCTGDYRFEKLFKSASECDLTKMYNIYRVFRLRKFSSALGFDCTQTDKSREIANNWFSKSMRKILQSEAKFTYNNANKDELQVKEAVIAITETLTREDIIRTAIDREEW